MSKYIKNIKSIDKSALLSVGGKGINLGELSRIDGINVPGGFCITTEAYKETVDADIELKSLLENLYELDGKNEAMIRELSKKIRDTIENLKINEDIQYGIDNALSMYDENQGFAVRSSATAEDLPYSSFAGQQDTFLNVVGRENIMMNILKCWASLFTDRAIFYRIKNGFDHRKVFISVIVQKMVLSEKSGIMFTANPMSSDRKTLSIDAGFGLGEALVSGYVNPDNYHVIDGSISKKSIGNKTNKIVIEKSGGSKEVEVEKLKQVEQVLENIHILELAEIGKKIESHFSYPQDIEWCYADNKFFIVQSRPITTLFPLPQISNHKTPRIYMSIGHVQMMTDPIKPLGISFFEMISESEMTEIGGRLYVDITYDLSSLNGRNRLIMATGKQDPLIQNALKNLVKDKDFMREIPKGKRNVKGGIFTFNSILEAIKSYYVNDFDIVLRLLEKIEREIKKTDLELRRLTGIDAIDYILADSKKLIEMAYNPKLLGPIITSIMVNDSLNSQVKKYTGEKDVGDILTKSLDHNVTTKMGLALGDLADVVRKYPEVEDYLSRNLESDNYMEELKMLTGGQEVLKELKIFMQNFGMRCPGEIDITKERFEERPSQLIPIILNNIKLLNPNEHKMEFEKRKTEALIKENEILAKIKKLPRGNRKAKNIQRKIKLLRTYLGMREDPKYYIVKRFYIYKKTILKEAERLKKEGVIKEIQDIYYLYLDEFRDAIINKTVDYSIIEERREKYKHYEKLTPPRVITSDGFVPASTSDSVVVPESALCGVAVSSGTVEGRARIILSVDDVKLEKGDILVTRFTDPSWTPLFVTIKGLVTEVGGFTTHSAIITREYGLPGVVGVENATKLIKDGQRIRVNGTDGYVEILD